MIKKKTVYLAGPIAECDDSECNDWRNYLIENLPEVNFKNPMVRDARGKPSTPEIVQWVVDGDKEDIEDSDFIIVNYEYPSVGTSMEIIYAYERHKHVYVVSYIPKEEISPWILYHTTKLFNSYKDLIEFIKKEYLIANV